MVKLPPWCAPPEPWVGRSAQVDEALEALAADSVTLVGAAGVGTTVLAGVVATQAVERGLVQRVVALRLEGALILSDLVRGLGCVAEAPLPGRQASVVEALAQGEPTLILLDDADFAPDAVRALAAAIPECRWLTTGRAPVLGRELRVPPLSDADLATLLPEGSVDATWYRGRPLLARLPQPPTQSDPWAAAAALPPSADLVAHLPMGLSEEISDIPAPYRVPGASRVVLRRGVREALGGAAEPSSESLTATARDRLVELHEIACDLVETADPVEIVLWRRTALHCEDVDIAALAGAAAARLLTRFFQTSEALALVQKLLSREAPVRPGARALLRWVEGDALLAQGEAAEAERSFRAALLDLSQEDASDAQLALSRRCAEQWSQRGEADRARAWLAEVRALLQTVSDRIAEADALRIAADLSARAGEMVGAANLYDEASARLPATPGGRDAQAMLHLGQAALEIARGQLSAADRALKSAENGASHSLSLQAATAYRRSEVALRRGKRDAARTLIAEARQTWRKLGNVRGIYLAYRMEGDLAAVEGDRHEASVCYQQAIQLSMQTRDLQALHRVLRRAVAVEREGVPGPRATALEESLDLLEALLQVR